MSRKLNRLRTKMPLRDRMERVRPPTDAELPHSPDNWYHSPHVRGSTGFRVEPRCPTRAITLSAAVLHLEGCDGRPRSARIRHSKRQRLPGSRADVSHVRDADEDRRRGGRRHRDPDGDFPHLNAELRDDGRWSATSGRYRALSRVGFIVTNMSRPAKHVVAF